MIDANDVAASLHDLSERTDIRAAVVIVVPTPPKPVEVYGFGPLLEEGAAVDSLLDSAKRIIRK
jgi:hypothetical protein